MAYPGPQDQYGQQYPQQPSQPHGPYPQQPPNPGGHLYAPQPQQQWQGPPPGYRPPMPAPTTHNWAGLVGLIVGILAVVCDLTMVLAGIGFWLGLVGVIFSGVGLTKAKIGTANNRPLSITGMILSVGAILLSIIMRVMLGAI
ncbi:hypothetical protein [Nonomuraea sp. NPDC001023]|uniref:hypothetical protein n=1 Tax=unclassified Nonomuraea TaxID=2593643 RepID=UPI00332FF257